MTEFTRGIRQIETAEAALRALADRLSALPPEDALRLLGRLFHSDGSPLSELTHVLCTGTEIARKQAQQGAWPDELALALAYAANALDEGALDLDEALDRHHLPSRPAAGPSAPRAAHRSGRGR
ncbi:hypothetical protein [Streptomyces sp. GZWMJZ-114]|uniref:hypothetical protein n=1 Tax=Streptomyces sp. GZWMJZ-114 TaxID=2494734 RepID=UPI0010132944|nr:hypothetical protein [Streptomyces sp. GZWMJZ-114]